jgi:hypothetical protein
MSVVMLLSYNSSVMIRGDERILSNLSESRLASSLVRSVEFASQVRSLSALAYTPFFNVILI